MAISRLLQNVPLGPGEIDQLIKGYEAALYGLGLNNREDPVAEVVAKRTFETWQTGIRDPAELAAAVVGQFGKGEDASEA